MRFRTYLDEMTIRTGNLTKGIEPSRIFYEPIIIKDGQYIGDLRNLDIDYKIYQSEFDNGVQYGLYDGTILATLFDGSFRRFKKIGKNYFLDRMITKKEYAGQHLSAKLLMFLKTREKIPVVFSDIHSIDTVHNIRKIARTISNLQVSWFNTSTGETDIFDPETDDKDTKHVYGINGPTKWRIMIEAFPQVEDGKFTHFIHEAKQFEITNDYNIWDMAYCNQQLAEEVYQEGL
jgi:hypothetical protein